MHASIKADEARRLPLGQTLLGPLRPYSYGRLGLIALALTAVAAGLYFSWGWLGTVGVAPFLVALAPCAVMCTLGLCMNKTGGKSCSTEANPDSDAMCDAVPSASDNKTREMP